MHWLDRLLELAEKLLILVVRSDPEPYDHIALHDADSTPIEINSYRVDGKLVVNFFESERRVV